MPSINFKNSTTRTPGIFKTKTFPRSKVFFLRMDQAVEKRVQNCIPCQATTKGKSPEPIQSTPISQNVWEVVNGNLLGPLPDGTYVLVFIDEQSRYPEIYFVKITSATTLMNVLNPLFARYGMPNEFSHRQWSAFQCTVRHAIQIVLTTSPLNSEH